MDDAVCCREFHCDFQDSTPAIAQPKHSRISCADPFVLLASSSSIEKAYNVICVSVERMMSQLVDALWEQKEQICVYVCVCVIGNFGDNFQT